VRVIITAAFGSRFEPPYIDTVAPATSTELYDDPLAMGTVTATAHDQLVHIVTAKKK
jgi:hypothetical protein